MKLFQIPKWIPFFKGMTIPQAFRVREQKLVYSKYFYTHFGKVIVLTSIFIFVQTGCDEKKIEPKKTNIPTGEIPAQESWGTTIILTDSGATKAILTTAHLRQFTLKQETLLDDSVHVDFFDRSHKKSTTLTSKRGKIDDSRRNLYAYENVVAKNDSGVVLLSEELMWNSDKQQIITDKFVTIITRTEKIQGYGFESDQFLRNYTIHKITYITNGSTPTK